MQSAGEETFGSQAGYGLWLMTAGERNYQYLAGLGIRRLDSSGLGIEILRQVMILEVPFGARYFPRAPTFRVGRSLSCRATLGIEAALAFGIHGGYGVDLPLTLSGGLATSLGRRPSGLLLELAYRPSATLLNYYPSGPDAEAESLRIAGWIGLRASYFFDGSPQPRKTRPAPLAGAKAKPAAPATAPTAPPPPEAPPLPVEVPPLPVETPPGPAPTPAPN